MSHQEYMEYIPFLASPIVGKGANKMSEGGGRLKLWHFPFMMQTALEVCCCYLVP